MCFAGVLTLLASGLILGLMPGSDIGLDIVLIGFGIVAFPSFALLGNKFLHMARRKIRLSIDELVATDPRYPILFLRSFREDQVVLPSPRHTLIGRILALGFREQTLDELLL